MGWNIVFFMGGKSTRFLYVVDINKNKQKCCNMAHPLLVDKRHVKETLAENIFGGEPAK